MFPISISYSFFYVEIYSTNAYKNFQKVHIIDIPIDQFYMYILSWKYIISLYSAKKWRLHIT